MGYPEHLEIGAVPLRRWEAQRDLAIMLALVEDEAFTRFIPIARDEATLAAASERFAQHWADHGFGLWAVRPPDGIGGGWVGACHPKWHPEFATQVELAWSLTASLRGRGLVTRGATAAARACFEDLGLEQVVAFVDPANAASLAVAQRLGMEPDGTTTHPSGGELRVFRLRPA